jgi:hypothetical protein
MSAQLLLIRRTLMNDSSVARIRELNDAFRTAFAGGKMVMTASVAALPEMVKAPAYHAYTSYALMATAASAICFGSSSGACRRPCGRTILPATSYLSITPARKIMVIDRATGVVREAETFVAVLGASNYTYAEATWTQKLADWIEAHGDWIRARHNLLVTGPCGVGKSWLACALGNKACRDDFAVAYHRVPRLFAALALGRADGRYTKMLRAIARLDLLILDDWGPEPLDADQRRDLLEIVEDRYEARSIIVTSQLPVDRWYEFIGNPTIPDAILDRIVHNAYRIELKGESLRKQKQSASDQSVT